MNPPCGDVRTVEGSGIHDAGAPDKSQLIEALRRSEEQYRTLVENINDVVFSVDTDGHVTYISPAIERMNLWDADDVVGQPFSRFIHPDDLPGLLNSFSQTLAGKLEPFEFRVIAQNGSIRHVQTSSRPVFERGATVGLTGLLTDITDRKHMEAALRHAHAELERRVQERTAELVEANERLTREIVERGRAEETLRESEDRWRRLVEHNPACLAVHREGKLVYVNPAGVRLFRLPSAEAAVGQPLLGFVHPDYRAAVVERVRRMMTEDIPVPPMEEKFLRSDGTVIDVEVTAIPTTYLGARAIMTVSWDITERKRSGEALRSSEERYRQFFEMDLTADYISRPDGTLTVCNPAYVNMFGFASIEEAMRTNVVELYPHGAARDALIALLKSRGTLLNHEMELRRRDGAPLHVIANITGRLDAGGNLVEIQGYLFDQTPRKLLEQQFLQAQKMEAVGRLAGGVAHDFNNMLGVILGMAELILEKMSPMDPLRRKIETIRNAAHRSSDVARQLLAFASKQTVEPRAVNLNASIAAMHRILERLVGESIRVTLRPGRELWPIRMDPTQVDQILANLATNARDAIEGGGEFAIETGNVKLDEQYCRTRLAVTPGDYVRLSISDTGRGMDEETKRRMFEPFFTTKPIGQGTGLGLSTVYGIVTQNSGFIDVASTPGSGTTITIFFPRLIGESGPVPVVDEQRLPAGSGTVLVVEDEIQLLELARVSLEEHGYQVIAASSPGDALLACERHE
ncbi:MAG: PAS domain S-box protein, partial [Candidatus Eisenbacteria bacterium]|nr:PAS domain S-box protein [Candidatus Eisenbacteria bacterium]